MSLDVAIYGGSFDPVSLHHIKIGVIVHSNTNYPIWFMPCWNHQYNKELTNPHHRLSMCKIVTDKYENFETCDFEIRNELNESYYQTLLKLKESYPEKRFHTIIGTDNANDIADNKWINSQKLIEENPFIVIERGGYELTTDWPLKANHKYLNLGNPGKATEIRKAIKQGNNSFVENNLDQEVWEYIQKEGLYQ